MIVCPSCDQENPDGFRMCGMCGAQLTSDSAPAREQRKVVTVLFCDLVGSTALGESTDPEALRARMRRYFEDLRAIIEQHGGTVEKFVGDAVMAVFGIPVSHEDDALRAVRAAAGMRAAIGEHGLEARIGVNTGEVVVGGESETLVTGDAVNVAARLEQAAPNGEILIGAETRLLVRDAVRVEPVEPLALKGKSEPVAAFRLLEVLAGVEPYARHLETPLVGRASERERLWRDFEDALEKRACRLFTLLGPAGIGKSRLVADFLERVGDEADVLRGRCLSYGEGITYWPLVEILIAIGAEPDTVIGTSSPETQLAFRRLLESRAGQHPQVVVIDDLQWAEPVFVDLVEHVADLSRDAPIFLLCIARTELLDTRPGWGGGKLNATSLLLEPLGPEECSALMDELVADAPLADDLRERITRASAGNPLYVEEMLAMVREYGSAGEIVVPPTIHALLQARIDSLDGDVRMVIERGSVEGEVFHRGSVAVLSPEPLRPAVESHLATLVRKELIRSTSAMFPNDEGFRFRHLLIRDAAYESLPKATRAELHERFADWLSGHDLVESDEIVGYHLEQAYRYLVELGPVGDPARELAERAASVLASSGRRAFNRGDAGSAANLLERAVSLLPSKEPARVRILPSLGRVLRDAGRIDDAGAVLSEAVELGQASNEGLAVADATVALLEIRFQKLELTRDEVVQGLEKVMETIQELGDKAGMARALTLRGKLTFWAGQAAAAYEDFESAARFADKVGDRAEEAESLLYAFSCMHRGPMPADEALARYDELRGHIETNRRLEQGYLVSRAHLEAMQARFDVARELVLRAKELAEEQGQTSLLHSHVQPAAAYVEQLAGNIVDAERQLQEACERTEHGGELGYLASLAPILVDLVLMQGRDEEALQLTERWSADRLTDPKDVDAHAGWRRVRAKALARLGHLAEAEPLAREAVAMLAASDYLDAHAAAVADLGDVLNLAGKLEESAAVSRQAIRMYEQKGNIAVANARRALLATSQLEV